MRTFLAGLAIFLSFFTGAAALTALPTHQVLLDPDLAGETLANALGNGGLRNRILPRIVPGYASLPASARARIDRLVEDPDTAAAVSDTPIRSNGTVDLAALQQYVSERLRDNGEDRLAATVENASSRATVTIPAKYFNRYQDARRTVWQVTVIAGLATVLLYALALLVSRRRPVTLRSAGVALILGTAVAVGLHWVAPDVVEAADLMEGSQALALTMRAHRSDVLVLLAPFALAGVIAAATGTILGRSRQFGHSAD